MFSLLVSDNLDKKSNKWGRLCAACAKLYKVKQLHRPRQTLKRDGKIIYTWVWREKTWKNMKNRETTWKTWKHVKSVFVNLSTFTPWKTVKKPWNVPKKTPFVRENTVKNVKNPTAIALGIVKPENPWVWCVKVQFCQFTFIDFLGVHFRFINFGT